MFVLIMCWSVAVLESSIYDLESNFTTHKVISKNLMLLATDSFCLIYLSRRQDILHSFGAESAYQE